MDTVSNYSTEDLLNGHGCGTVPFTLKETIMISFMTVHSFLVSSANLLSMGEKLSFTAFLKFLKNSWRGDKILQIFVIFLGKFKA